MKLKLAATVALGALLASGGVVLGTSAASGSSVPFGLKLVEVLKGAEAARQVCHAVHYHG